MTARIVAILATLTLTLTTGTTHASYLKRDACRAALLGANGDNDLNQFAPHYFLPIWDTLFVAHPANNRVIVAVNLYYDRDRFPHRKPRRGVGYCMGTNLHVVDKMGWGYRSRPAGWGPYPIARGEVPA